MPLLLLRLRLAGTAAVVMAACSLGGAGGSRRTGAASSVVSMDTNVSRQAQEALSQLALAPSSSRSSEQLRQPSGAPLAPPLATVVLAANASADERNAAEMIADELGTKTCGQALPVRNASHSSLAGGRVIAVGAGALRWLSRALARAGGGLPLPLLPADSGRALGDDGYVLAGGGARQWLALSGRTGSPRGTSYAAVELLEAVGLRFFAWDCTTHPACPDALPALNRTQGPPQFTYRSIYMWQAHVSEPPNRFHVASHNNPAPVSASVRTGV